MPAWHLGPSLPQVPEVVLQGEEGGKRHQCFVLARLQAPLEDACPTPIGGFREGLGGSPALGFWEAHAQAWATPKSSHGRASGGLVVESRSPAACPAVASLLVALSTLTALLGHPCRYFAIYLLSAGSPHGLCVFVKLLC